MLPEQLELSEALCYMSAASRFPLTLLSVAGVQTLHSPVHGRAREGRSTPLLQHNTLIGKVANLACNMHPRPISAALKIAAATAVTLAVFPQPFHNVRAIQFYQQCMMQKGFCPCKASVIPSVQGLHLCSFSNGSWYRTTAAFPLVWFLWQGCLAQSSKTHAVCPVKAN